MRIVSGIHKGKKINTPENLPCLVLGKQLIDSYFLTILLPTQGDNQLQHLRQGLLVDCDYYFQYDIFQSFLRLRKRL